jgi:Zn finger protein HypA/HybF involved in hydrogenase expression
MHELSIGHAVPQRVRGLVASPDANAIGQLTLRIGPLEGVELNKLRCAFPLVAAGASCEDSSHETQQTAIEVCCRISLRPLSSHAVM